MSESTNPVFHAVFDCVIYAQALISNRGPAWHCLESARAGKFRVTWSDYVLVEIRELPEKLPARLGVTPERVEAFIADISPFIQYVADAAEIYVNPFDRDDSHYVNLAAACAATLISTRDGDLLRLMDMSRPEARDFRQRFPALEIVSPEELLRRLRPTGEE